MKKLLVFLILGSFLQAAAQEFERKVYKDVIRIDDAQVAEMGGSYLVDIPVSFDPAKPPVFFLDAKISPDLLKTNRGFYPELKAFILIVPDWAYYQSVAESTRGTGITCAEPIATNIYYHIKRTDRQVLVDSQRIQGNEQPELHFRKLKNTWHDTLVVYRTESYGSTCCPEDPMWKISGEDIPFVKNYEQQNKLRIAGTFRQNNGKEGEYISYYSLAGLTAAQRLSFMLAKRAQWIVNKELKFIEFPPAIFTPQLVPFVKEGFRKMEPVYYGQ